MLSINTTAGSRFVIWWATMLRSPAVLTQQPPVVKTQCNAGARRNRPTVSESGDGDERAEGVADELGDVGLGIAVGEAHRRQHIAPGIGEVAVGAVLMR